MNHGQVIGASDKHAGEAVDRPVRFGDVFATLYTSMGINVETATIPDLQGRLAILWITVAFLRELV